MSGSPPYLVYKTLQDPTTPQAFQVHLLLPRVPQISVQPDEVATLFSRLLEAPSARALPNSGHACIQLWL